MAKPNHDTVSLILPEHQCVVTPGLELGKNTSDFLGEVFWKAVHPVIREHFVRALLRVPYGPIAGQFLGDSGMVPNNSCPRNQGDFIVPDCHTSSANIESWTAGVRRD